MAALSLIMNVFRVSAEPFERCLCETTALGSMK